MNSAFKTSENSAFPIKSYRTLNTFLSEAAARWPEHRAIIEGATKLSWSELDQISARVSSVLVRQGARPGDRVAVCAPKTARTLAGLHGVLKAGCVCVPIDPVSPAARAQAVLDDCSPVAIIGSAETLPNLTSCSAPIRISIGARVNNAFPWAEVMSEPIVPASAEVQLSDLAYLLYTSGSTGQPKGVMLSHENVSAFATWAAVEFQLSPQDRVASVAPLHFDLSTFDLYSTAWSGATLCIPPALHLSFPTRLTSWLADQCISAMYTVPSLLAMMAERGDVKGKTLSNLRLLLFAGEVCPPRLLASLLDLLPDVEFANLYGPTETNVCTYERIDRERWDRVSPISIGVPCQGTRALLISESGSPLMQRGEAGELLISGPTVALGYWNDPTKSGARFILRDGERWCRTGDYAEFDKAGHLVFHGRRDHMVKIHGHRVELGDVETALLSHPKVAEAAVVAMNEELVAFARTCCANLSSEELREHCASRLPRYMVPIEVNILEALPYGSTGKIDRLALQRIARHE